MILIEIAPDKTLEEIRQNTSGEYEVSPDLKLME
jgi:acyl CoA:acetate/3-ketoacid CoA transferase beta subunit